AGMTWSWTSELTNSTLWVQCESQTGPIPILIHRPAPSDQMKVTVTNPDQSTLENFYSVWPGSEALYRQHPDGSWTTVTFGYPVASENGALIHEYAMPFTRLTSSSNRFLSTRRYGTPDQSGVRTLLRTEYVRYERDDNTSCFASARMMASGCLEANHRLSSSQTVYHDDSGRTADTDLSDFDGFGHYRKTNTGGTFAAGNVRTAFSGYNPGSDADGNI